MAANFKTCAWDTCSDQQKHRLISVDTAGEKLAYHYVKGETFS